MFFRDIPGQQDIKGRLIQSVMSGRVSHAQLFLGPEGCGNLPMAVAYARYISCLKRNENDSCGTCSSCIKYNKFIHPDLHFIFPVNSGKKKLDHPVSDDYINEWREKLLQNPWFIETEWYEFIGIENKQGFIGKDESQQIIRKLSLKPFESDHKILIIWLPERMNPAAANKLLKLIEEPPDMTVIIMVSESTEKILPTILSRLQVHRFSRISDKEMKTSLKKKFDLPENQLDNLIHISDGNYHRVLEIMDSSEEIALFLDKFASLMRICHQKNINMLVSLADELHAFGREKLKRFLDYSLKMIRENYAMNYNRQELVYLSSEEKSFSERFHPYVNRKNVHDIYTLLNKASGDIESNAYARIVLLDIGLQLFGRLEVEGDLT
ncbi:MAG: DNA polymerase III subunit delta [Bacteroidales bacterium]|nr:DNA polymerase III subunit delta [Bacteroidales bacterium]